MTQITDQKILDAIAAVKATGDAVKGSLVERDEVIDLALLSIVAESNMFLCGQPGIAKSAVFGDIFNRIGGARKGFFALTKGSVPDMLVGPMSIKAMTEEDRIRHNTAGMLPDVHLAFIDEVFKGNALTRNALLTILNERVFYNGGQQERTPLIMAAAASNEYPDTHEDAAFWDRFVVRMHVEKIRDRANRRRMIRAGLARGRGFVDAGSTLQLADLETLIAARDAVAIPDDVLDVLDQLLIALDSLNLDAALGDRRVKESFYLVAANALLDGRDTAMIDDLSVLRHTLWSLPDTRREIQQTINRIVNPALASITDLEDQIESHFEVFLAESEKAAKANNHAAKLGEMTRFVNAADPAIAKIKHAIKEIEQSGRDGSRAREVLARAQARVLESQTLALTMTSRDDDVAEDVA